MDYNVTTTNQAQEPALTIAIAIDTKTTAILAVALFVALLGALFIYKYI